MTLRKRLPALLLAVVLAVSLSGCAIPIPGFADYDVSGYVKALLDSSYHQENEEFMSITGATKTAAQQNNTDTVENAAVLFCNTYGLYPNEEQLQELQEVMRTVYRQTQYTVKEEQKTDKGYYIEVEIRPIINFQNRTAELAKLKTEAQDEAIAQNRSNTSSEDSSEDSGESDGYGDDYGGYGEDEESWEEETESSDPLRKALSLRQKLWIQMSCMWKKPLPSVRRRRIKSPMQTPIKQSPSLWKFCRRRPVSSSSI